MKRAPLLSALGLSLAFASPLALSQQTLTISEDAQAALELAEEIFPDLFKGGTELRLAPDLGYIYRYYEDTQTYVGFKGGRIYVMGAPFGPGIHDKGEESVVLAKLEQIKLEIGAPNGCNEEVTGQLGCGDWDIKITGSVTQTIMGMTTTVDFDEIILRDVPVGGDPATAEQIEDMMTDYFEDIGTISNLEVVIVSQSDDHIILDVAFDAVITQQGITVSMSYDLRYEMTKH
mgnify:FL=1